MPTPTFTLDSDALAHALERLEKRWQQWLYLQVHLILTAQSQNNPTLSALFRILFSHEHCHQLSMITPETELRTQLGAHLREMAFWLPFLNITACTTALAAYDNQTSAFSHKKNEAFNTICWKGLSLRQAWVLFSQKESLLHAELVGEGGQCKIKHATPFITLMILYYSPSSITHHPTAEKILRTPWVAKRIHRHPLYLGQHFDLLALEKELRIQRKRFGNEQAYYLVRNDSRMRDHQQRPIPPQDDHRHLLFIRHLPGKSLFKYLQEDIRAADRRLPLQTAILLCALLVENVRRLHEQHLLHSDIKPENYILDEQAATLLQSTGDTNQPLPIILIDFGFTEELSPYHTKLASYRNGTPWYEAPELFTKNPIEYSRDIYALAITLLDILLLTDILQQEMRIIQEISNIQMRYYHHCEHSTLSQKHAQTATDHLRIQLEILEQRHQDVRPLKTLLPLLYRMLDLDPTQRPSIRSVHAGLCAAMLQAGLQIDLTRLLDLPCHVPERATPIPIQPLVPPTDTKPMQHQLQHYLRTHTEINLLTYLQIERSCVEAVLQEATPAYHFISAVKHAIEVLGKPVEKTNPTIEDLSPAQLETATELLRLAMHVLQAPLQTRPSELWATRFVLQHAACPLEWKQLFFELSRLTLYHNIVIYANQRDIPLPAPLPTYLFLRNTWPTFRSYAKSMWDLAPKQIEQPAKISGFFQHKRYHKALACHYLMEQILSEAPYTPTLLEDPELQRALHNGIFPTILDQPLYDEPIPTPTIPVEEQIPLTPG